MDLDRQQHNVHLSIAQIERQEQSKGSLQFVNPFALLKNYHSP